MSGTVCAALIAGMCIISGCREKFAESSPSDSWVKVFVDSVESDNTSKTALAADGSVQWIMQDKLMVFDEDFTGVQFSTTADYSASAVFISSQWTGKTPVYASCSNSTTASACATGGFLTVELAGEQTVGKIGTFGENAGVSVGRVWEDNGSFRIPKMWNATGLLRMDMDRANIASVTIEGLNDEILAGFVTVNYGVLTIDQDNFWTPATGKAHKKSVSIRPTKDAVAANGCFKAGSYYVALLPQTYSRGLRISLTDKNGAVCVREVGTEGITVKRSAISAFSGKLNHKSPDEIIIDLDFYNGNDVNPLGFGSLTAAAEDADKGETYTYKYSYESMGEPRTRDLEFVVCKGTETDARYAYTGMSSALTPQGAGTKVLYFSKSGGWIKVPAISGYYLQSVSFSHGNTSPKQMQVRITAGDATNLGYTSQAAGRIASSSYTDTQTVDLRLNSRLKTGTGYYLYFKSGVALRIYDIKLVYVKVKHKISIIGDSISTFTGWLPETYAAFYPNDLGDVDAVDKTWWHRLIYKYMDNAIMERNLSFSGTLVTENINGSDFCYRYIRHDGLGNPDIIFIHGGTNDYWNNITPLAEGLSLRGSEIPSAAAMQAMYDNAATCKTVEEARELDCTTFCTAYIKLLTMMRLQYPSARIICIIGDYFGSASETAIRSCILAIAAHYGAETVDFPALVGWKTKTAPMSKYADGIHPDAAGMDYMARTVFEQIF